LFVSAVSIKDIIEIFLITRFNITLKFSDHRQMMLITSNQQLFLTLPVCVAGSYQYWLFFYNKQFPTWKGIIFIFLKFFGDRI